ncbi:MAG: PrsW family intramembrane metalloprotease [Ignavibacteriales bacterium]|nr:PrsW family intramembrane metalloprotease [Ignavibacteriales bacterium]
MPSAASFLAAAIPMLIYLWLLWKMDKYEREPLGFVIGHFLWGAIGAIIFAVIGSQFVGNIFQIFVTDFESLNLFGAILIAPFVEEITKGIFLVGTVANRKFDNITDGLVYGGAIGLGFGMTENFLYFDTYSYDFDQWIFLVIIRSAFTAVMHAIATGTFGAFLGMSKFSKSANKKVLPFIGLFLAMTLHGLWNLSVSFQESAYYGLLFMIVVIIVFIIVFTKSIRKEREIIKLQLTDEVERGIIPIEHLDIISSTKRERSGWINEAIRKNYIKVVTKLAFRKFQTETTTGKNQEFYIKDAEQCRIEIKKLLNNQNDEITTQTEV